MTTQLRSATRTLSSRPSRQGCDNAERSRIQRYVQAAMQGEVARLRSASSGRWRQAYRSAFALGSLVWTGHVSQSDIVEQLTCAATDAGMEPRTALRHIMRGVARGAASPRDIAGPGSASASSHLEPPSSTPAPPAPAYPPRGEVQDLLFACIPTADDAEVAAYLRSRGLDPERIDHEAVAYALPMDVALPSWAGTSFATWTESDHRLLLPALDAAGRIVSIRARRIRKCRTCKTLSPSGFTQRGTLFADSIAHNALAGVRAPMRWVFVEGDIDFLTWTSRRPWERDDTIAVVGIYSGSWHRDFAAAVPNGARVVFRGHDDASGHDYMEAIQADLRGRAVLLMGAN